MTILRPWRVTASRTVLRDRWISVRADDCVTAEGADVSPFYVLEYPDWVHVVALSPEGQVLLVRQYRHGLGGISLEIPAGGVDPGDRDPLAAARRELVEETGCVGGPGEIVQRTSANPATHTNSAHTVLIRDARPTRRPAADPSERIEVCWTAPEEAYALALSGAIPALHSASLMAAFARLGWLAFSPPASEAPADPRRP